MDRYDSHRMALIRALGQYGHPTAPLEDPELSPVALARRQGIPETHITGAFELIGMAISTQNQPAEGQAPGIYIGIYSNEPVYAANDPFDQEVIDAVGGMPAFAPLAAGTPPPQQTRPVPAEQSLQQRPVRTIMDALYVLGYGHIQPSELSEPDYHETLLQQGRITSEELAKAYARLSELPFIDARRNPPHPEVRNALSSTSIKKYGVIPHSKENNVLTLLVSDPTDTFALVAIEDELQGATFKVAVASKPEIDHLLLTLYHRAAQEEALAQEAAERRADRPDLFEIEHDPDSPVAQRINAAFAEAIANGASDIHFQPQKHGLMVRERVDQNLINRGTIPSELAPMVINRLKMLAGMNTESRQPQDSRINLDMMIGGRKQELRLRVNALPSIYGDSITMRILGDSAHLPPLEGMAFHPKNAEAILDTLQSSNGLILVSGPTGSGKTTLLHSMLKRLNTSAVKIMTIEDPIEYEQPGLVQTEIKKSANQEVSLNWAQVLHAQLRQDPNIILVGEIRDSETASIATEGAQTGRLLISTVHANSAIGSITRLSELGVPTFLLGDVMRLAVAQRLVGRPCPDCSVEEPMPPQYAPHEGATMLRGTGRRGDMECPLCNGTGDKGVIPIHEVLPITEDIRRLIKENRFAELPLLLQELGYPTLMQDGLQKVANHEANLKSLLQSIK